MYFFLAKAERCRQKTHPGRIYKGSVKQVGFRTGHETILQQESRSPDEVA